MALFCKLVTVLSVVCLRIFFNGLGVESTPGSDYLDEKEFQVKQIAQAMQDNAARECELLKTCTTEFCTRHTCQPREGDSRNPSIICLAVKNNKYCKALDGINTCPWKKFDYTRSYVRTASTTDPNSLGTTLATCAQRELDPLFMNISKPDSLSRVYAGLIDGAWRAFPGSYQRLDECGDYETRTRPWYRDSTSVTKVVVILIDAGVSMSSPLKLEGKGTVLSAAKNVTEEFLKTFNVQDNVNIIMFNSTHATALSPSMVPLEAPIDNADTTSHPELEPLRRSLRQQDTGTSQTASNVTMGINLALSQFGNNYPQAVKIIVILSDGKFATASDVAIPTSNITASNVKVFVYTIYQSQNDLVLGNTSFGQQLCSVRGNFEVISRDLGNPLYALKSVFSFTAALRASVANYSADYSIIYPEYDQINGDIITVSRPVFGVKGMLLGVAGITIYINELGNLTDQVKYERARRNSGTQYVAANFVLRNENCSLQNAWPESEPCGVVVSIPANGSFCRQTDMTSSIQELTCCGDCIKPAPQLSSKDAGSKITLIIAVSVGGVAVVVFCLILCFYKWRRGKTLSSPEYSENLVFPGDNPQEQQADNHRDLDKTPAY